ncbi:pyridoxal phosphate-dependent aminotransferase [Verrucomicrobiota bacterium]
MNGAGIAEGVREVDASPIREIANLAFARPDVLRLHFGESSLPTPAYLRAAASAAMESGWTFYSENQGLPSLREALARKYRQLHGVDLDPSRELVVTASGVQALNVTIRCTIDPGDEAIILCPNWPNAAQMVRMFNGRVKEVPYRRRAGDWLCEVDWDALERAVTPRSRLLVYTSPSNPLGRVAGEQEQLQLLEFCRRHGLWLLADEVYERLYYEGAAAPSVLRLCTRDDAVIVAQSFSKTYCMTGWRVGWVVSREDLVRRATHLNEYIVAHAPTMLQKAAETALEDGEAELQERVGQLRGNRDFCMERLKDLPGASVDEVQGAFYLFVRIAGLRDSFAFARQLLDAESVSVAPGAAFGAGGGDAVRICFATERAVLETALERFGRFVVSGSWAGG